MCFIDCSYNALIIAMQQPQCFMYAYMYTCQSCHLHDSLLVKLVHWWPWQMVRRSDCRSCWKTTLGLRSAPELPITSVLPARWSSFSSCCVYQLLFINCCVYQLLFINCCYGRWNFTFQCSCIASAYLIQLKISNVICLKHCDQVALLWHPKPNNSWYSSICPPTVASQS